MVDDRPMVDNIDPVAGLACKWRRKSWFRGAKIVTMQPVLSKISSDIYLPNDVILHQSWGWNLVDNHLLHNGDSQGNYPQLNNAPKYQVYIYLDA